MTAESDRFYMRIALELAEKGQGRTSPNPAVGCVVVREGRVVGRGFHPAAGEPHAEVYALREAGDEAIGADLYVTLEPCAHHGRTPPCADLVARSGVQRVVAAAEDPNPRVAGQGLRILRDAGIRVDVGVLAEESRRLNEAFNLSIVEGRSFVHLKLAATLDGKIATRSGHSRWITSEEARARVHELRDRCGAVAVGVGTAVADDPGLTVRLPDRAERHITRFVLDPSLRAPLTLRMLRPGEARHTVLVCGEDVDPGRSSTYEHAGVDILRVPRFEGKLDLGRFARGVYERGLMEVLVEGGAETARGFMDAGLVDRLHVFLSLRILGGRDSVPMVGGASPNRIEQAWALDRVEVERVGTDIYVTGLPSRR